jgi:uncharacterized caspase-like protein
MPIDLHLAVQLDYKRMLSTDDIVADLQHAKIRVLVLDASRDYLLIKHAEQGPLGRCIASRCIGGESGLERIEDAQTPGMIVALSVGPGQTAREAPGRNSTYTAAFLRHIEEREEIATVFRRISRDVYDTTNGKQGPYLSLSLIGEFYLNDQRTPEHK